jgi:hypothetical protein
VKSAPPDPTGAYYRYSYSHANDFKDFPKMGVWPDACYIISKLTAAMDRTGGIAVGHNVSSSSVVPSMRYAYRGPS